MLILHYGIERSMGVTFRCKLATHNEKMSKLQRVSLFQIFSAMFLPNITWFIVGKVISKIKKANFLMRDSAYLFIVTIFDGLGFSSIHRR